MSGGFMSWVLIAVFAQNLVFSGAGGVGLVNFASKSPKRLISASICISVFSLLGALPLIPFDRSVSTAWSGYMPMRGLLVALFISIWYLIISYVISKLPSLEELLGSQLWAYAFCGATMAMPLLLSINDMSAGGLIGACLGSGPGFALAVLLISFGMKKATSPAIPSCFRGTPATLIYIGLLSLIFSCFPGK